MIEIFEYYYDPKTGEERFEEGVYITPQTHSITFNTYSSTGMSEVFEVDRHGHIRRSGGETVRLWDPTKPRLLRTDVNIVRHREIFIAGSGYNILCIRRLPPLERRLMKRFEE